MVRIDEPHPFALETASEHYAADRRVRAQHLRLELALDFDTASISGVATHTVQATRRVEQISFDAVELEIRTVHVDGRRADFDAHGVQLHVHLPKPVSAGATCQVRIAYRSTPRRGLYFVRPDAANPRKPLQAWTQGQDEDARSWFPCLDAPAQKCTTELSASFPATLTSLSNGALHSDSVRGGTRTMHWRLDAPHSPYLVTLVVGTFETLTQRTGKTVVRTLFPKGRKADALRCVERTPKMIAFFERLTGQRYPWGDYAQVFVADFIFGGMENTGATTLTDAALHDARAHADYSAEPLISHELAHQWFGDLLTCRDWPHGWLNEGFATWAEVAWKEEADGLDEADHQRKVDLEAYLSEVADRYERPLVARRFDAPIDLFDRHLYEKGALVLHELRTRLGDDAFFASIQRYVADHRGGTVETVDLARTVEAVSGANLDRFFDEYVHRAGHPKLKVEARYDAERRAVRLSVTQEGELRQLTLPVALVVGGREHLHRLEVQAKEHTFWLPAAREPTQCVVDARRDLLAELNVDKPAGWWRAELNDGPIARARTEAATALGKDGAAESVKALAKVLLDERAFWGTRAACAKALAVVRAPAARAALLSALRVRHPKARRAAVAALGDFRDDVTAAKALRALCQRGDPSVFVEAEAARSLGRAHVKGAVKVLTAMLRRASFQDVIRGGALEGLAALREPAGWPHVVAATAPTAPAFGRRAAVMAVAKLADAADQKSAAVDLLGSLMRDSNFRVRLATIDAAMALGDDRLIEPLTTTRFLDGREQRAAREAVRALRAKAPPKELAALRADVEKLRGELKELRERADASSDSKRPRHKASKR